MLMSDFTPKALQHVEQHYFRQPVLETLSTICKTDYATYGMRLYCASYCCGTSEMHHKKSMLFTEACICYKRAEPSTALPSWGHQSC